MASVSNKLGVWLCMIFHNWYFIPNLEILKNRLFNLGVLRLFRFCLDSAYQTRVTKMSFWSKSIGFV